MILLSRITILNDPTFEDNFASVFFTQIMGSTI